MRLTVRHITRLASDPPADRCSLRLRLYPSMFDGQKVKTWKVSVNGVSVPPLSSMMAIVFGAIDRLGHLRIGFAKNFTAIDHQRADQIAAPFAQHLCDCRQ